MRYIDIKKKHHSRHNKYTLIPDIFGPQLMSLKVINNGNQTVLKMYHHIYRWQFAQLLIFIYCTFINSCFYLISLYFMFILAAKLWILNLKTTFHGLNLQRPDNCKQLQGDFPWSHWFQPQPRWPWISFLYVTDERNLTLLISLVYAVAPDPAGRLSHTH